MPEDLFEVSLHGEGFGVGVIDPDLFAAIRRCVQRHEAADPYREPTYLEIRRGRFSRVEVAFNGRPGFGVDVRGEG